LTTFGVTFEARGSQGLEDLELAFVGVFDGLISRTDGRLLITVYGEGVCGHAVAKSLALELESVLDISIVCVDQDLVDIPEIAHRTSRTRQSIQQLVTGVRGSNDFPTPLGAPGGKRIWDWSSVNEWLRAHQRIADDEVWLSRADVAIVNAWLIERKSVSRIEMHPGGSRLDEHTAVWLVYNQPRPAARPRAQDPFIGRGRIATIESADVAQ
jgi:hypothetical protein